MPADAYTKVKAAAKEGATLYRAASSGMVQPLTSMKLVRDEYYTTPKDGAVEEARRIVDAHGQSAWAYIYSNGSVEGVLPGDGKIAASVHTAHVSLRSYAIAKINNLVGETREREAASEVADLASDLLALDVDVTRAVKLLGGIAPRDDKERRSAIGNGTWGQVTGPTAVNDIERAMGDLGELLAQLHSHAGGGKLGTVQSFGLVRLARLASQSIPPANVLELFDKLFKRLGAHAAKRRKGHWHTAVDIAAYVKEARTAPRAPGRPPYAY